MSLRVGVDLGGTKIEAVALDEADREVARLRAATPQGDYDGTIREIGRLIEQVAPRLRHDIPVGIGTPGTISPFDGLMKNSNSVVLNGRPLHRDLEAALGRPIVMRNDADCFALSEAIDGAAAGEEVVFGVIVGTGVGGGVVVDGRVRTGPNRVGGEWGHNPLPWPTEEESPGPDCYCGKHGCIETWVSGPALAADHQRRGGREHTAPEIADTAREGDSLARESLARYVDRLARSLATVINVLDPDVVVLGGGMSNLDLLYEQVPVEWEKYVFGGEAANRLLPNQHGDSSGVRGAAMLVPT